MQHCYRSEIDDQEKRFVGGRRRYNARRRDAAVLRRRKILGIVREQSLRLTDHGVQAALARTLGVHRSTVHRDLRWLLREWRRSRHADDWRGVPCPLCGR